jgi:hypothetical protein
VSTRVLHDAAGLTVAADVEIPGLTRLSVERPPDIDIHVGARPPWDSQGFLPIYRSTHCDSTGMPTVSVGRSENGFHFAYADGTHVWLDAAGTGIWCITPRGAVLSDTATYLTGPILGFALRRRGAVALHASGVVVDGGALLLVGPHGVGKSTTAATLAVRGCTLVSDDVVHVRRGGDDWLAEPFAPGLRLWPGGAALALGAEATLPRLTPGWDKRYLQSHTHGIEPARQPVPIRSIAFLELHEGDERPPRLMPIGAAESVARLAANSSASHLLDRRERAEEFTAVSDLVRRVRCTRAIASGGSADAFADLLRKWAERENRQNER